MNVRVTEHEETDTGWRVHVTLPETGGEYVVEIDRRYMRKVVGEDTDPETVVRATFAFLLDREPASSILPRFNLRLVESYFPEYPQKIGTYITHS